MNGSIFEVIIIGAGQAGLGASYYLKHLGLEHMVFEQGRIGETWRTQRWDNFRMITNNKLNVMPGSTAKVKMPDELGTAEGFVSSLRDYASTFELPVSENSKVLSVEKSPGSPVFTVKVSHDNEIVRSYDCWQLIIASGSANETKIPAFSSQIASHINQLHSSQYRNAWQFALGSVLVVGSGQSGCQIAEDLMEVGKPVFIASSIVPRIPRSYRGRDIIEWLILCKSMDAPAIDLDQATAWSRKTPLVSANAFQSGDLSLQSLARKGAIILGSLEGASGTTLSFKKNVQESIKVADDYTFSVMSMIDEYILSNQLPDPVEEVAAEQLELASISEISSLKLEDHDIQTILWATGYQGNLGYVNNLPIFNKDGTIIQQFGVTPVDGLYVVGLPWQRAHKSNFIFGIKEDAGFVTNKIYSVLR